MRRNRTLFIVRDQAAPRPWALFKADYPRAIDRYIDYFGNSGRASQDMCGEALLDVLADDVSTPVTRAS